MAYNVKPDRTAPMNQFGERLSRADDGEVMAAGVTQGSAFDNVLACT
jgi:hypothetical protein